MNNKADLHLHSTASDGKLSAKELINEARKANINVIALTDHDTVGGIDEAKIYSVSQGIKLIPGIELSANYNNESIHVLGYFKDNSYKNKSFQNTLQSLTDYRQYRAEKIVSNLEKYFSIKLNYDKIAESVNEVIGRPHIAKAIIESGYDYSWEYIFKNFLSESSPAYVPKKNLTINEAIALLRTVNAIVVLAHPVLIKKTSIQELIEFSFDGIEAIYPLNRKEDTESFIELSKINNKLITAGSDFHGISSKDFSHGSIGSVYLNGEPLNKFMKAYSS